MWQKIYRRPDKATGYLAEIWANKQNAQECWLKVTTHDQFLFQLMHHNFTLLTNSLYMFRAPTCPSSGGQTIHTPQLVQLHLKLNTQNLCNYMINLHFHIICALSFKYKAHIMWKCRLIVQLHKVYILNFRWSWTSCGVCIACPPEDGHVGARNM